MTSTLPPPPDGAPALGVSLRPRHLSLILAVTVAGVLVLALGVDLADLAVGLPVAIVRRLGFTGLIGLPRVVNGGLLLALAGAFSVCAALTPRPNPLRWRWGLSAAVLTALAADEWGRLHTVLALPLAALTARWGGWLGDRSSAWLLAAAPLALAFALCWLPVLPRLPRRLLGRGSVAVAVYLLGAIGGALLGNRLLAAYGLTSWPYLLGAATGEAFEMGALVGLVALLLAHLRDTWGTVPIYLRPTPAPGLHLPPRSVALALGAVVALLTAAYVVVYVLFTPGQFGPTLAPLLTRFNLDDEGTFTAAFGGFLLITAAAVLGVIALYARRTRAPLALRWLALAVAFLGLTLDEFLSLHEILADPVRRTLHVSGLLGLGWYVPVLPLVAVFGLFCLEIVLRVPRRTGLLLALAGLVYVGGAVGIEMLAAVIIEIGGRGSQLYLAEVALEETLEMLGALLFIYTLLDYLARGWGTVVLNLRAGRDPAPAAPV